MRKLWQAYKYVFYWLYVWNKRRWGDDSNMPEVNAALGMSLSLIFIITSLGILFHLATGNEVIFFNAPKIFKVIGVVALIVLHEVIFRMNGRFKKIEREFGSESAEKKKWKGCFAGLYVFGSFVLFGFLLFFGVWVEG